VATKGAAADSNLGWSRALQQRPSHRIGAARHTTRFSIPVSVSKPPETRRHLQQPLLWHAHTKVTRRGVATSLTPSPRARETVSLSMPTAMNLALVQDEAPTTPAMPTCARVSFTPTLVEKRLLVAHHFSLCVAHMGCATNATPLVTVYQWRISICALKVSGAYSICAISILCVAHIAICATNT
jgi:hypothetical protein